LFRLINLLKIEISTFAVRSMMPKIIGIVSSFSRKFKIHEHDEQDGG
jgi:hypothetical protein